MIGERSDPLAASAASQAGRSALQLLVFHNPDPQVPKLRECRICGTQCHLLKCEFSQPYCVHFYTSLQHDTGLLTPHSTLEHPAVRVPVCMARPRALFRPSVGGADERKGKSKNCCRNEDVGPRLQLRPPDVRLKWGIPSMTSAKHQYSPTIFSFYPFSIIGPLG